MKIYAFSTETVSADRCPVCLEPGMDYIPETDSVWCADCGTIFFPHETSGGWVKEEDL